MGAVTAAASREVRAERLEHAERTGVLHRAGLVTGRRIDASFYFGALGLWPWLWRMPMSVSLSRGLN